MRRLKVAEIIFISVIALVAVLYLWETRNFYLRQAAIFPWIAGSIVLVFCLGLLTVDIKQLRAGRYKEETGLAMDVESFQDMSKWETYKTAILNFAWMLAIYAGILLFGFHISITLFFIAYLIFRARLGWFMVPALTLLMALFLLFFGKFLGVWWPEGFLEQWVKLPYWLLH